MKGACQANGAHAGVFWISCSANGAGIERGGRFLCSGRRFSRIFKGILGGYLVICPDILKTLFAGFANWNCEFAVFGYFQNIGCRFSGRQRGGHLIRAGMAAEAGLSRSCFLARVASRAYFALFSGANSDPLKTPPSHGFIDLDAIKSVAKRTAAFRGHGIPRISLFFAREPTP